MPGLNAFDMLAQISRPPLIVFTTAFDEYAIRAFDANAIDYLLKPIQPGRLAQALEKVSAKLRQPHREYDAALQRGLASLRTGPPAKLAACRGKRIVLLAPKEVLYVNLEDGIAFVHTQTERFMWEGVRQGLAQSPKLIEFRDERGRNWLHLCCGVNIRRNKLSARDSIRTAEIFLNAGLDINTEAFREGDWKATPLWYAVAFSQNFALAEYLLERGSDPNHCMWAAAYNNDAASIRLLVEHGAPIDLSVEDASPFLFAVQWSRFSAAEELLKLGANVNFQNSRKLTALHCLLKKGADKKYIRMLLKYGARGDLQDAKGITAAEIMRRKRDPELRKMAAQFGRAL